MPNKDEQAHLKVYTLQNNIREMQKTEIKNDPYIDSVNSTKIHIEARAKLYKYLYLDSVLKDNKIPHDTVIKIIGNITKNP